MTDIEKQLETATDDLADRVRSVLEIAPAGSWAALVYTHIHDELQSVANHIAAFGLGVDEL